MINHPERSPDKREKRPPPKRANSAAAVSLPEVADTGHRRGDYSTTEMPNTGQRGQKSAEPMTGLDPDAMDKVKGGVSYPPNLADAKRGNTERDKRHTMPEQYS